MKLSPKWILPFLCIGMCFGAKAQSVTSVKKPVIVNSKSRLKISGVYPHLALFNDRSSKGCGSIGGDYNTYSDGAEGGIGAVVPWAGKLWMVTYSPHCPLGSSDKLYSVSPDLQLTTHPESIGGTPANRMIHKESNQLITSSYFIDSKGKIRVIPFSEMPGRMTATARHLKDPANRVYFYDMEGMVYEVNVHTLKVNKLFNKPVPGWHGKGAYTSQGLFVVANNGEIAAHKVEPGDIKVGSLKPANSEEMGVLASWDGKDWKIVERKQFTDVTGPGGIYGAPNDQSPLWSIGWDKRSVILKLLDGGQWYTYRLPKATHTYDHRGGWYTEWPRIREVGNGKMLMDMHGMFYDFPKTFSRANSAGIAAVSTHLRYIPDFCYWNGQLILSTDETTMLENPMAGRAQSNLWFGQWNDLKEWGAVNGWGGPWVSDTVKAGVPSDAFLANGFQKTVLHLTHSAGKQVQFTLEIDKAGNNKWQTYKTISVGLEGYSYFIFPAGFSAQWMRVKTDADCVASAFFYFSNKQRPAVADAMFTSLANANDKGAFNASLIRPAGHNKNLQVLTLNDKPQYMEVDETIDYNAAIADSTAQMQRLLGLTKDFEMDEASIIVKDKTGAFRLPKGTAAFDQPFNGQWPRGRRELESERLMLNAHGTFYEIGREAGYKAIRPVATHNKKIMDFCTWRGLLVLSGTKINAGIDEHYFPTKNGSDGLWFGAIDDLWKLGKPVGEGGVWKNSAVTANTPSLPYLMTGYDKKSITLQSDKDVTITLEVDVDLTGWHQFKKIKVPAGKKVSYVFPDGYNAHWIRATADKDCIATVWLKYE